MFHMFSLLPVCLYVCFGVCGFLVQCYNDIEIVAYLSFLVSVFTLSLCYSS